jgi:hypothetical protein
MRGVLSGAVLAGGKVGRHSFLIRSSKWLHGMVLKYEEAHQCIRSSLVFYSLVPSFYASSLFLWALAFASQKSPPTHHRVAGPGEVPVLTMVPSGYAPSSPNLLNLNGIVAESPSKIMVSLTHHFYARE